jgi:hypothetical protein
MCSSLLHQAPSSSGVRVEVAGNACATLYAQRNEVAPSTASQGIQPFRPESQSGTDVSGGDDWLNSLASKLEQFDTSPGGTRALAGTDTIALELGSPTTAGQQSFDLGSPAAGAAEAKPSPLAYRTPLEAALAKDEQAHVAVKSARPKASHKGGGRAAKCGDGGSGRKVGRVRPVTAIAPESRLLDQTISSPTKADGQAARAAARTTWREPEPADSWHYWLENKTAEHVKQLSETTLRADKVRSSPSRRLGGLHDPLLKNVEVGEEAVAGAGQSERQREKAVAQRRLASSRYLATSPTLPPF